MELFVTKNSEVFQITFYDDYPFGLAEAVSDNEEIKDKLQYILGSTENEIKDKILFASLEYEPVKSQVAARLVKSSYNGKDYETENRDMVITTYRLKYYVEIKLDAITFEDIACILIPAGIDEEVIESYSPEIESKLNQNSWKIKIGD